MLPVLTPEQSAAWDVRAAEAGIALETLMECAGRAVASVIADRFPERLRQGVLIGAGTGNNGGDGWVVARALHRAGIPTWVAPLPGEGSALHRKVAERARGEGVRTVTPDGPWPNVGLAVDAILGTGASGAPRKPAADLAARLLDLGLPVVAVDGPTGLDLLTGVCYGPARADLSVTFGGLRRGHLLDREDAGSVVVVDIGHPGPDAGWPLLVTDALASAWLPRLQARDHKGTRGRVVVIGGGVGMSGAARMSARAAFGAGAGLVHVIAPGPTVEALVVSEPDVQTLSHDLSLPLNDACRSLIGAADAVVVGPGLGRGAGKTEFVLAVLDLARRAVVDADALIALQGALPALAERAAGRPVVLTPHFGEFRAVFPTEAGSLESDPWSAASLAARACGGTVLLKGVPTVIASNGLPLLTVAAGNPGLATGGSGDVLSGIIGAALAHGLEPQPAAALGAQILGRAADIAARRTTARALRPMDVVAAFADLWRAWEVLRATPPVPRPPVLFELPVPDLV